MQKELCWFGLNVILICLMWLPYILNALLKTGILPALTYSKELILSDWAIRAKKAHANAVENFVVFAPVFILCLQFGHNNESLLCAVQVYFFARLAHYVLYIANVPFGRTLSFAVGWAATLYLAFQLV